MLASSTGKNQAESDGVKKPGRKSTLFTLKDRVPIDQWLFNLESSKSGANCNTKVFAKLFLYIAKYEPHPSPEKSHGIDFR